MMKVIENLKTYILNHDLIKNSVLGYTRHWRNNHYDLLSETINDVLANKIPPESNLYFELGNTISSITLKRIFEGQIKPSAYDDLRFLKTLDKLTIFLDYKDLNEFIFFYQGQNMISKKDADFEEAISLIKELCETEYQQVIQCPDFDISKLSGLIIKNSPYEIRVKEYWEKLKLEGMRIKPGLHNYEVYDFQLISKEENMMVVTTMEFWNLIFDTNHGLYTYHKERQQTYFIKKDERNEWKIWDNYNPDLDELIRTRNIHERE